MTLRNCNKVNNKQKPCAINAGGAHQSSTSSRLIMAAAKLRTVTPLAFLRSMLGAGSACGRMQCFAFRFRVSVSPRQTCTQALSNSSSCCLHAAGGS